MDLLSEDGVQEVRRPLYRVSIKLLCLQERLHLNVVSVRHVWMAFSSGAGGNLRPDARLNQQEVTHILSRMFQQVSQEVEVDQEAMEEICSLTFRMFDGRGSGGVSGASLKTLLIILSGDSLQDKYTALVGVAQEGAGPSGGRGSISRSGLESLLRDLSQVPAAVQEVGAASGSVEAAVTSCFHQVSSQTASPKQVMSWLRAEPPLLLWLSALSRLSLGRHLRHDVRCHCCKTRPLTGLRYRCLRCVNVQVCQNCFLTDRHTKRHKRDHPVLELSTQPTWRESLTSVVRCTGHIMLPWRQNQRGVEGTLMWAEPPGTSHKASPPPDSTTALAAAAVSHDALCSSKCVQTEEQQVEQVANLLAEVRNLQRDKWLFEQQLQAWRLSVQSEQSILENRCSGVEGTLEVLRRETSSLEGLLTQALNKAAAKHAEQEQQEDDEDGVEVEGEDEDEDEGEGEGEDEDEYEDEEVIRDMNREEEAESETPGQEEAWPQEVDLLLPHAEKLEKEEKEEEEEEQEEQKEQECVGVSVEQRLQQAIARLRMEMEIEIGDRWSCPAGSRKGAELVEAAGQIGASIHNLVDALRTTTSN